MSMFRRAILNAARMPPRTPGRVACPTLSRPVAPLAFRPQRAWYSAPSGLSKQDITDRIIDTLKGFEKVPQEKLTTTSHFGKDLGLDSLDAVEVVMAIEEEFGVEIPDVEADAIQTVEQAIEYIAKTPDAV